MPSLTLPKILPFSFLPFLAGKERIAGIAIHEGHLRSLFLLKTRNGEYKIVYQKQIPLEQGVILRGEVKNEKRFLKALKSIRDLSPHTSELILSLPDSLSYNILLDIPEKTPLHQIDSIAKSHLEAYSPIPLEGAFYDWEESTARTEGKKTILISVAPKNKIRAYLLLFEEAGFNPVAVETHIHSLRRALEPSDAAFLLITLLDWGVETRLLKKGAIIFEHSVPLEKEMVEDFKNPEEFIVHSVNRVIEFYLSEHPSEKIEYFSVIREDTGSVIRKEENVIALLEKTLGIPRQDLKSHIKILAPPHTFAVIGAALRGTVLRRDDKLVSLAAVGTEELWRQTKLIVLGKILSDFIIIVSTTLVLTFGGTWAYLNFFFQKDVQERLRVQQSSLQVTATHQVIRELETNITAYNEKVRALNTLYEKIPDWTVAIGDIVARTGPGISVGTIDLTLSGSAHISGSADTIGHLIDFRNILSFSGLYITDIKIPLSFFEAGTNLSFSYVLPFRDINVIFPYYFYKSLRTLEP